MFEQSLIAINDMMQADLLLALTGCYLWGLLSTLLSPCHLASIPLLLSYAAGQEDATGPRQASVYALLYSLGLFCAIFVVGGLCALVGRMLGEVPAWVYPAAGLVLIVMGVQRLRQRSCCSLPTTHRLPRSIRGRGGAFLLGGLYGILSGVCTFGFLAPMLAVILQQRIAEGLCMTLIFALGHCTPIVAAGCSAGFVQRRCGNGGRMVRWVSSLIIIAVGIYFLVPRQLFS